MSRRLIQHALWVALFVAAVFAASVVLRVV